MEHDVRFELAGWIKVEAKDSESAKEKVRKMEIEQLQPLAVGMRVPDEQDQR